MKNVLFTKSGPKDLKSRVTVTLKRLNDWKSEYHLSCVLSSRVGVTILHKGITFAILFTQNRHGESATYWTTSWPVGLPSPKYGKQHSIKYEVIDIYNLY